MKTKIDKVRQDVGDLYDSQSRKLFDGIIGMGPKAFYKEGPLHKFKDTNLLEKLIKHFEKKEEYEKCGELKKIGEKLENID